MDKPKPNPNPNPNPKSKPSSNMDGLDLPPSDAEEEIAVHPSSSKEMKKREKGMMASVAAEDLTRRDDIVMEKSLPLLQLIKVSFSYPSRKDFKLSDVDLGIDMGTRVAIVGSNGAGKSTLLNLLAGDLVPTEGEVRRSQELRIGRYSSQHFVGLLTMEEYPVQYLLRLHLDQEDFSKQLVKFGHVSDNLERFTELSGGRKARVVITSVLMSKPHILLLDEPTNHLDMQSIDALAELLEEFSGGVVLVSHDSRLISRVCEDEERSEIWVVEEGTVRKFPGSFEEYKEGLLREIRAEFDD